jgi:hypothetical protein
MSCAAQTAGPHCSVSALEPAAASHIEFINDCAVIDILDLNMQNQLGSTDAKTAEEEAAVRITAVN